MKPDRQPPETSRSKFKAKFESKVESQFESKFVWERFEGKLETIKNKLHLSNDKGFWLTVVGLLLAPIALTYLFYGVFIFSHSIVSVVLKLIAFALLIGAIGLVYLGVPALFIWGISSTIKSMGENGFDRIFSLAIPLLTVALGASLGLVFLAGNLHNIGLVAIALVRVPWTVMLAYLPVQQMRRIKQYRQSERYLIEP